MDKGQAIEIARKYIDLRIEPHQFDSRDFNRTNPVVDEILKSWYRHQY